MTATTLPPVWFERPVLAEVAASVATRCTILGPATGDDPFAGLSPAVGAVVGAATFGEAAMERAPGLVVIARTGIGYDGIDVAAATRRGIAVCNTPDGPTISTAEHAVTLMLLVAKNVKAAEGALRTGPRPATTAATWASSSMARSWASSASAGSRGTSPGSPEASACASRPSTRTSQPLRSPPASIAPTRSRRSSVAPMSCPSTSR